MLIYQRRERKTNINVIVNFYDNFEDRCRGAMKDEEDKYLDIDRSKKKREVEYCICH